MLDISKRGNDTETSEDRNRFTRRPVLRGAASAVIGGLGVTAFTGHAVAHEGHVTLDVKSNINLESGGVIPAVVEVAKGDAPCFLPVGDNVVLGPRFGPSRLFDCDPQGDPITFPQQDEAASITVQQQDDTLCALEQAEDNGDGATPVHGGHRQGKTRAMLHFRTQEADFVPEDINDNGKVEVSLLYAVEEDDVVKAVGPSCLVKGVAPMN